MTETKKLVRAYNELAMNLPDKVWTKRFAHPRMELVGNRVYMEYNVKVDDKLVPKRELVAVSEVAKEILRLKRRAYEKGAKL